jgi:hypothetical protein
MRRGPNTRMFALALVVVAITRGISGYIERHLTGVQAQLDLSGRAEYFAWHQTHRFRT